MNDPQPIFGPFTTIGQYRYHYTERRLLQIEVGEFVALPPTTRFWIAVKADELGSLPIAGTVVGAVRIVFGLLTTWAMAIAGGCAHLTGKTELRERCFLKSQLAINEFMRGWFELIPFMINSLDEKARASEHKNPPELRRSSWAYGKFAYATKEGIFYAEEEHPAVELRIWGRPPE